MCPPDTRQFNILLDTYSPLYESHANHIRSLGTRVHYKLQYILCVFFSCRLQVVVLNTTLFSKIQLHKYGPWLSNHFCNTCVTEDIIFMNRESQFYSRVGWTWTLTISPFRTTWPSGNLRFLKSCLLKSYQKENKSFSPNFPFNVFQ